MCLGLVISRSMGIIIISSCSSSSSRSLAAISQYQLYMAVDPGNCCLGNEDAVLKAAEVGAGENEAPGPPPVWPVIAWVGVGGGGVPPELPKLPPPAFEMLLFTGEICVERSDD